MQLRPLLFLLLVVALSGSGWCARGGGRSGGGSRSGGLGGGGGGWFGSSKSSSNSAGSYPKQQWGTNTGNGGSGGYPKQQWSGGSSGTNSRQGTGGSGTALGGGGFVNPKGGHGSSGGGYGSSGGGYGTQYRGYGTGQGSGGYGYRSSGYSYRSPGYGTNFGTNFAGGRGIYGGGRKSLGLGVGAGFLGGAAVGAMTGMATMGVYHRYMQYRMLMGGHHYGHGYSDPYYNQYYRGGQCMGGCPMNAYCEYGFCECRSGYVRGHGQCYRREDPMPDGGRGEEFDPFVSCDDSNTCQRIDMNMVCNTNVTVQQGGRCECRRDFRWNLKAGECQFYLDVDCSAITYDTPPSPVVLEAVNATLAKNGAVGGGGDSGGEENDTDYGESVGEQDAVDSQSNDSEVANLTMEASLKNSLLSNIDPAKATEADIREAFCRDVDSFSFEFGRQEGYPEANGVEGTAMVVGIVALLIFFTCFCAACCVAFKKTKQSLALGRLRRSGMAGGAAMAGIQELAEKEEENERNAAAGGSVFPNPTYQAQATPLHAGPVLHYPPQPTFPLLSNEADSDPVPIPPTQPGYTNIYPPPEAAAAAYPQPAFPPAQPVPYPPLPENGGSYPPQAYPPQAYPPQAYPPQAYPPQAYPPSAAYPPYPAGGTAPPYQPPAQFTPSAPY